jgi:hypothetical protein
MPRLDARKQAIKGETPSKPFTLSYLSELLPYCYILCAFASFKVAQASFCVMKTILYGANLHNKLSQQQPTLILRVYSHFFLEKTLISK